MKRSRRLSVTNQEKEIPHQCTGPNAQAAIQSLDDIITWLSQETDVDAIRLLNIKAVRRVVLFKVTTTSKQMDIRAMLTNPVSKQSQPAT